MKPLCRTPCCPCGGSGGGHPTRLNNGAKAAALSAVLAVLVMVAASCAPQLSDSEAFPGQTFSEGTNNMLNYAEDLGRTEYTGERLGHRSRSGTVGPSETAMDRPPREPLAMDVVIADASLGQVDQAVAVPGGKDLIPPVPLASGDIVIKDVPPEALKVAAEKQSAEVGPIRVRRNLPRPSGPTTDPAPAEWRVAAFLASYRSEAAARAGWSTILGKFAAQLEGLGPEILRIDVGAKKGGVYYRLFAAPFDDRKSALDLCRVLEDGHQFCRTASSGSRIQW